LVGVLAAFFMPSFNLYKVFKVHHFSLDFLFAGCFAGSCFQYTLSGIKAVVATAESL